jgi:Zn-dependent M16 (insulinase) family peptidase
LIATELLSFVFLLPSIRERGGAYGAGCALDESGIISFYSYRDPNCDKTYDNFEKSIQDVIDGRFTEGQLTECKLLAFQKLDRVSDPSAKGLLGFTRGYEDEDRLKLRLRALEVTKEDVKHVVEKYMMGAIEDEKTSRVVFGSQSAKFDKLETEGWNIYNPIDFLSYKYFD